MVRSLSSGRALRTRWHRPGMTKDTPSPSRGAICPSFAKHHARKQRAQETPGARPHPQPRVRIEKSTRASHHRLSRIIRRFLRNGFNGFLRALPGEPGLLSPSPAQCASIAADLISASGYQDHTTSPSAFRSLVSRYQKRPPHPAPNVRDDRDTPLFSGAGWREVLKMICPTAKAKYLR